VTPEAVELPALRATCNLIPFQPSDAPSGLYPVA